jgi:hypothetical protein
MSQTMPEKNDIPGSLKRKSAMKENSTAYSSKSLFMRGIQCPKSLCFHKFHPEWKDEVYLMAGCDY